MAQTVQISRFSGGMAITRVVDGSATWDRHYRDVESACREAYALGLISNTEAVSAAIVGKGLKLPCIVINPYALLDAGFEKAHSSEERWCVLGNRCS